MKILLDTHTFIWRAGDRSKLSPRSFALCQDPANTLLLSVASVWEMQVKLQLGKMQLTLPLADIVTSQQQRNHIGVLLIRLEHVLALDSLPLHHRDPFDRMIVAQANVEDAVLLSHDAIFKLYPVATQW